MLKKIRKPGYNIFIQNVTNKSNIITNILFHSINYEIKEENTQKSYYIYNNFLKNNNDAYIDKSIFYNDSYFTFNFF